MVFVPSDQQKKYINLADDVLNQYKSCLHRARRRPDIGSPRITGMPTGSSSGYADDDIVNWVDDPNRAYCEYCRSIVKAIEVDESTMFASILRMRFFGWNTPADIMDKYRLTHSSYYDAVNHARLVFGESVNMHHIQQLNMEIHKVRSDD